MPLTGEHKMVVNRDLGDEDEKAQSAYGLCGWCSEAKLLPPDPDCPIHGVSAWLDRMQME